MKKGVSSKENVQLSSCFVSDLFNRLFTKSTRQGNLSFDYLQSRMVQTYDIFCVLKVVSAIPHNKQSQLAFPCFKIIMNTLFLKRRARHLYATMSGSAR